MVSSYETPEFSKKWLDVSISLSNTVFDITYYHMITENT